jgi:hypothetical protein
MGDIAFGGGFNMIQEGDIGGFLPAMHHAQKFISIWSNIAELCSS